MISLIIPTRNRARLLNETLRSLCDQTLSTTTFEVIVVDNGSTDQSASIVQSWFNRLTNLRYFYDPEPGLHTGRHRGIIEAQSDVLVFTDDDIKALPNWLSTIVAAFKEPAVAMMGGNNLPMFLRPPPNWINSLWIHRDRNGARFLPFLSIQEQPDGHYEISPYKVWGCNFAIRKQILLEAGGFHPDGMPRKLIRFRGDGETHVSRYVAQKGLKCIFDSEASIYHKVPPERMTFRFFRQRGFNQGVSDSYTQLRCDLVSKDNYSLADRLMSWGLRKLLAFKNELSISPDARKALSEFRSGHQEGYIYHQNAYRNDPEVRKWVHRERYF